jgi:serine protease Do
VVKKALGIELSDLTSDLRRRYKIKDSVSGVVVTAIDANSPAAGKRVSPGDVIVEVQGERVASPDAMQARLDQLKKDGRKVVMLLLSKPDGETQFVALSLQ